MNSDDETDMAPHFVPRSEQRNSVGSGSGSSQGHSGGSGGGTGMGKRASVLIVRGQPFIRRNSVRDSWHSGSTVQGQFA